MDLEKRYQNVLDYLYYEIGHFNVKLGLENITELLRRWNNPQDRFCGIHVGGTNGKGSVCAALFSLLRANGYRVGMLTSPHLVDFRERIRLNDHLIPKKKVIELVERLRPDVDEIGATYFEILTAMAYLYFVEENVDFAVVEVGMGGRLDATQLINPAVSVITNISLEHTRHLGDTVEKIAIEKGGIIKSGVPLVVADRQSTVLEVLHDICTERDTSLIQIVDVAKWENIRFSSEKITFDYFTSQLELKDLEFSLPGRHQVLNAVTALVSVAQIPQLEWTEEVIRQGLGKTVWHGRIQLLQRDPYIVVDGAHNPASMAILAESLNKIFTYDRLILIFSVLKGKKFEDMIPIIKPMTAEIIITQAQNSRSVDYQLLAEDISQITSVPLTAAASVSEAIQIALKRATKNDLICIAGSLYIVGEALDYFGQIPENLI